jgi:hypothetical protein
VGLAAILPDKAIKDIKSNVHNRSKESKAPGHPASKHSGSLRPMHEILQLVGFRIFILQVSAVFIPSLQPIVSNHSFQVEVTSATWRVLPPFCSERFPFATVVGILSQLERAKFLNTELICSRSFKLASHSVVKHDM